MKITIGITSFNRLKYLKCLISSLEEISKDFAEIIVVDNCSTEIGIKEYLSNKKESGVIDSLHLRSAEDRNWTNDEYIAKNIIIAEAKTDTILFLQDDLQFISTPKVLLEVASSFHDLDAVCCELNAIRNSTIKSKFIEGRDAIINKTRFWAPKDNHFHTMGLFKKQIFNEIGPYPVDWPQTQEFWGRSEDWYDHQIKNKFPNIQLNVSTWVPLFAPVWNDPRGGYAFIRGDKRYGHYLDPVTDFYYEKISDNEFYERQTKEMPIGFSEICRPLGWSYKKDQFGDQIKFAQSQAIIDGPSSDF